MCLHLSLYFETVITIVIQGLVISVILVPLGESAACLIGHCISNLKSQQISRVEFHIAEKLKATVFGKGSLKEH